MRAPSFQSGFFWGIEDRAALAQGIEQIVGSSKLDLGWYISDNLIAIGRNLGFITDAPFIDAFNAHAKTTHERGILWRTATVVWAARQARRLDGGFMECGCYKGTTARIMLQAAELSDREIWLYDLFEHDEGMTHHAMPEHGADLFAEVTERFAAFANVSVVKGWVPQSFEQGMPDRIAFLHIDMNSTQAEVEALEALEDRLVPGAVIVLDDFGAIPYRMQHIVETQWFQKRGRYVLELPTSQGLVIW